jgi:hypothetical protein
MTSSSVPSTARDASSRAASTTAVLWMGMGVGGVVGREQVQREADIGRTGSMGEWPREARPRFFNQPAGTTRAPLTVPECWIRRSSGGGNALPQFKRHTDMPASARYRHLSEQPSGGPRPGGFVRVRWQGGARVAGFCRIFDPESFGDVIQPDQQHIVALKDALWWPSGTRVQCASVDQDDGELVVVSQAVP